jgi:serine/threonine protein kinase
LIERLLTKNPDNRISIDDALSHPWFDSFSSTDENFANKETFRDQSPKIFRRISTFKVQNLLYQEIKKRASM